MALKCLLEAYLVATLLGSASLAPSACAVTFKATFGRLSLLAAAATMRHVAGRCVHTARHVAQVLCWLCDTSIVPC